MSVGRFPLVSRTGWPSTAPMSFAPMGQPVPAHPCPQTEVKRAVTAGSEWKPSSGHKAFINSTCDMIV